MSATSPKLHGRHILIVEDEYFIATALARELTSFGADVIGPISNVDSAMDLVRGKQHIDGAILDINLHGVMVFDVAKELMERKVPLIFVTGYDKSVIPRAYAHIKRCEKPVVGREAAKALFG